MGQTANLPDIYSNITGKNVPTPISLTNENYKQIDFLIIDNLDIDSIFEVEGFENLNYLKADYNKIDSLVPLRHIKNLKSIDFAANKISNLDPLRKQLSLRYLDLCGNNIFDLLPISDLENLWTLDVSANKIEYLTDLKKLTVLQELNIANNNIKNLYGLKNLKELKKLYLGNNPLPNEELVGIKKSLADCKITYEFYQPEDDGIGKFVSLEIYRDIVFLYEHSNNLNTSHHYIYYLNADNNNKPNHINDILKKFIDEKENTNFPLAQYDKKRQHYWLDTDTEVSCQIEY